MKMNSRRSVRPIIAGLTGGLLGFLLVCISNLRSAPTRPVIAFIPRTSGTNLNEDMRRGAMAAAESAGYQIYWNAPTRADDVDRQIRLAENAVRRGAKALILGPTNPGAVTTLIDSLQQRKVPVVIVQTESPVPTGPYVTSVTPNQDEFGRLGAERIEAITGGNGEVAIVGLDRGAPETMVRARSFMRTMKDHPGIEVVAQSTGSVQMLEAERSTREIIGEYPALKALFAVSADATQGALLALRATGTDRSIILVGCDRDFFLSDNLRDGKMDSLVAANAYRIGYLAVQAALDGTRGRPLAPPQHVHAELLTRENSSMSDDH